MKPYQLPQRIIDLANEYDESKHPRDEDGKWTSGAGSASAPKNVSGDNGKGGSNRQGIVQKLTDKWQGDADAQVREFVKIDRERGNNVLDGLNYLLTDARFDVKNSGGENSKRAQGMANRRAAHRMAIQLGYKYNRATRQYE